MYENLEQRIAKSYLDLFPSFVPAEEENVSASEQKEFYDLMKAFYQLIYEEPGLLVPALHEDDSFSNRFNRSSCGKPGLQTNIRKFRNAVEGLTRQMFLLGQGEEVKFSRRQKEVLSRIGVKDLTELPAGWRYMSDREGAEANDFAHCFFRKEYLYAAEIYDRLVGNKAFHRLTDWMTERGYICYHFTHCTASDCGVLLNYSNPAWSDELPNGGYQYKIRHTGITVQYDIGIDKPCVIGLCIPGGLKTYLEHFDEMDAELQEFVLGRTKKCDGCRYCVQTDKTGKRPLAAVEVKKDGENYHLCPYFPGGSYSWTEVTDDVADMVIRMLEFMDRFIATVQH